MKKKIQIIKIKININNYIKIIIDILQIIKK